MLFQKFDGTDRKPRDVQKDVLKWLEQNWHFPVLAMNLPTGVGKSAILKAIQIEFGGFGIVPTNVLLDQYMRTYPDTNYVKGIDNYHCEEEERPCSDVKALCEKTCNNCPYTKAKQNAENGQPSIFNPISYYYSNTKEPSVIVVDEAHKLAEMAMLLTGISFRRSYYQYPELPTEEKLIDWLGSLVPGLKVLKNRHIQNSKDKNLSPSAREKAKKEAVSVDREISRLQLTKTSLKTNPESFVFYTESTTFRNKKEEYLHIKPVRTPTKLLQTILNSKKIILMSATLLESDLWDLGFKQYKYLDSNNPIPKENRPVIYSPASVDMSFKTDITDIANWIRIQLDKYPGRNTIVHVTYSLGEKLKPFFPGALFNTSQTKNEVLTKFKKEGGLWFAAGCAEGIDLPGDECRLNLIPMIQRGNPYDPVTKKQLAQEKGQLKYNLTSIKTLIQQAGRSTRGVDDHSITIIGDNKFGRLIMQHKQYIPKSFLNSIIWRPK